MSAHGSLVGGMGGYLSALYVQSYRAFLLAVEKGYVPDFAVRWGIRYLLRTRLTAEGDGSLAEQQSRKMALIEQLKTMPIAINTSEANSQHYEVPTEYFELCLGKWKKYSACFYKTEGDSLQTAEENMLSLYCRKAEIEDGMSLLDLGCGWGSLTLFMATAFPGCQVTGVSNSSTQKEYIEATAAKNGLKNVRVLTSDVNDFEAPEKYNRVLSIEMFEHMKNYQVLLKKIGSWLKPDGKVFIHHFCHKTYLYEFKAESEDDWMAKHFFTGGNMMSLDLLLHFQEDLIVKDISYVNGVHYSRNLEAWLKNMDRARDQILPIFKGTYGKESEKFFMYWRLFYLACSELFCFNGGEEWGLAHVLLEKPQARPS